MQEVLQLSVWPVKVGLSGMNQEAAAGGVIVVEKDRDVVQGQVWSLIVKLPFSPASLDVLSAGSGLLWQCHYLRMPG